MGCGMVSCFSGCTRGPGSRCTSALAPSPVGNVDGGTPAWTASLLHVRVQPRQELPWRREEEAMVAWVVTHHRDQPARRIVSEAKLPHQSH